MDKEISFNFAEEKRIERFGADISGVVNSDLNAAAAQTHMDKFHAAQGHGYAAEQANHLYDILTGQNAAIVGGDNAKNGADRLVNGVNIQTKYCQDAAASVSAAFEQGTYRYVNADGSLMQLEVPSDQYEKAIELMEKRIERGQVQGITDPAEAKNIVRRGHFTYNQAVNIVKAGTIESLAFDAVNGAVISTSAFGVTATLTFAQSLWNGDTLDVATEKAAYSGIQIGGAAFVNSVVTAQLMRTGLSKALAAPTNAIVDLLGPTASAILANALRDGANIYGTAAMNNVAKLLRGNIVTAAVMMVILSATDISNAFRGRISGRQLFKNIVTTAGGLAGGAVGIVTGKFILKLIAPGAGQIVGLAVSLAGAAAGGTAGGTATNKAIGQFIEDDAVVLVRIIEDSFCRFAQDYMLTAEEIDIVLEDLSRALAGETLLDMYACSDHKAFADKLVQEQIERLIRGRCRIYLPTEEEFIHGIGRLVKDAQCGTGIFSAGSSMQLDPVEIGRELTGQELSLHSARKGLYAAKQMNLAQMQAENRLQKIASDGRNFREGLKTLHQEREVMKNELAILLGEQKNEC